VPASPISPITIPRVAPPNPANSCRVVVVDDDDYYRDAIVEELEERAFGVTGFADGKSMLDFFRSGGSADAIVIDWRLGAESGLNVLKRARQTGLAMPIIVLTGVATTLCESTALDHGASDFIDKARGVDILARRIRRAVDNGRVDGPSPSEEIIEIGKLRLRPNVSRAYWGEKDVNLTVTEFNIVKLLAANAGEYVSYRAIYDRVRCSGFIAGSGEDGYRTNVRSSMKRIRNKFRTIDDAFAEIENFPAFGYRWRISSDRPIEG
jgi:two-component system response regulator ChvI